jgi:hypothetical protein
MLHLLVILVNLLEFIFFAIALKCLNTFKNSNVLLNVCLIGKSLLFNLTRVGNTNVLIHCFAPLVFPILCLAHMPISKTEPLSTSIGILLAWLLLY